MSFKWRRRMCWSSWRQEPIWEVPTWTSKWISTCTRGKVMVRCRTIAVDVGSFWNVLKFFNVCFRPFRRYLHHQLEEDLGKAAAGRQGHRCHRKPSWCVRHLIQEHWAGRHYSVPLYSTLAASWRATKNLVDTVHTVKALHWGQCTGVGSVRE